MDLTAELMDAITLPPPPASLAGPLDGLHRMTDLQALDALQRACRESAFGSTLDVIVPDWEAVNTAWAGGQDLDPVALLIGEGGPILNFFDRTNLRDLMRQAGLIRIERIPRTDPFTLHLRGVVAPPGHRLPSAFAVLSCGRMLPTDFFTCFVSAITAARIPLYCSIGAEWGPTLERAIEHILRTHPETEVIVTTDHDTVHKPNGQLPELLRLAAEYPEYAAIAPMQTKRNDDKWMFQPADPKATAKDLYHWPADLFPARQAHFGLTLLRTDALRALPHPWFRSEPEADGRWGDHYLRNDIHFWRLLEQHGHKAAVAARVGVGHLEWTVTSPGRHLGECVKQDIRDYQENPTHPLALQ